MLKRELKYKYVNDEGVEVSETEVHYFNLAKREVLILEVEEEGGLSLSKMMKEIAAETVTNEQVFKFFEKFVLMAYGVREDGGKRFEKSEELTAKFKSSLAYDALFDELAFSPDSAGYFADFIKGVMPPDMISAKAIEEAVAEMKQAQAKAELEAVPPTPST